MRQSDVITWLHDELQTFLSNSSLVSLTASEADDHVDLSEGRTEHPYPFVGITKRGSENDAAGIGNGQLFVDETTYQNGTLQSVTYRRDVTLLLDVQALTDGDEKLRDDLTDAISDYLSLTARQQSFPTDMETLRIEEATPTGRPEEYVYGDGIPVEIEYSRYQTDDSVTAAETVGLDIDADDADAFDRTL